MTALIAIACACTSPPAVSSDVTVPDSGDSTTTAPTCAGVFDCMTLHCKPPPPPPPFPPPKLPSAASTDCLTTCAGKVHGPERAAALDLAACVETECNQPDCSKGTPANQCLESCIWDRCSSQMATCGHGRATGGGSCQSGLACVDALAGETNLSKVLGCFTLVDQAALEPLRQAVTCMELDGPSAPQCVAPLEACACDVTPADFASQPAPCLSLLSTCHLSGPCGIAACESAVHADARPAANELLACLAAKCGACKDAECQAKCLQSQCSGSTATCLLGPCPDERARAGSETCKAGLDCVAACAQSFEPCCFSKCRASMSQPAQQAASDWLACTLAQCSCLSSEAGFTPCMDSCQACAKQKSACQSP